VSNGFLIMTEYSMKDLHKAKLTYESYRLSIAKAAYKEIKAAIDKYEKDSVLDIDLCAHWDGCISIDDTIFHEDELKENSDGDG
jgi:hypothetical protein